MAGARMGMPFERTGSFPIDTTFTLTKAEMLAVDDSAMPEKYFTVCQDDGKLYLYDKSATPSAETGKFSVMEGGSGAGAFTQDVLWENPTPNTWVNPVLSRSAREYDMILFEARQQDGKWCQSFLNVADLGIGEEKELLINGFSWITIKFTDDTHIVGVNGTSSATVVAQKITGIVFSRLDGTIGRWEKIGEWLEGGAPKEYTVELNGYNAFSFEVLRRNDFGWYNTALVLAEDFVVGEKVAIYGSDDVEVWIERIDATTIRRSYQNGGTAVGLRMYGYRETAISDADVQRIAAQVRPVPDGGTTGQALMKQSDADGDADWGDVSSSLQEMADKGRNVIEDSTTNYKTTTTLRRGGLDVEKVEGNGAYVTDITHGSEVRARYSTYDMTQTPKRETDNYTGALSAQFLYLHRDNRETGETTEFTVRTGPDPHVIITDDMKALFKTALDIDDAEAAIATKQDALTAGNGVEILPDGTINMTKNIVATKKLLWSGDARNGATLTLTEPYTDYDELEVFDNYGRTVRHTTEGNFYSIVIQTSGSTISRVNLTLNTSTSGSVVTNNDQLGVGKVVGIKYEVAGGGGGTVDQTYDAASTNAQSGTAVAEAIATVEDSTNFDVTPIPQGPTGANEINAIISNKDTENARLSYVRQSDGTLPNTVNLSVMSGLGEDSFELPTKALVDAKQDTLVSGTNIKTVNGNSLLGSGDLTVGGGSTENRYVGITRIPLETSSSLCTLHCQTKDGTNLEANAGTLYVDGYDRDYLYVSGGISYSAFTGSGEITDIAVIGCDNSKYFRVITDLDTNNFEIKQEAVFGFVQRFVGYGDFIANATPRYPFMLHLCIARDTASQTYKYALRASGGLFIPAGLNDTRGPLFINAYFKIPRYIIDYKQAEF